MKQYKDGTIFTICSEAELVKKGWVLKSRYYYHADFPSDSGNEGPPISEAMVAYAGLTFTIKEPYDLCKNWYFAEENSWIWPVATFLETNSISGWVIHECIDGITPIDGWIICKTCGKDLRKIR